MSNKEAIANVVDESQLPTNEAGEKADLVMEDRFSEATVLEQAGTVAHPEIPNAETAKERVKEVIEGATASCADALFNSIVHNDLTLAVAKLKSAKTHDEKLQCVEQIGQLNHKLSVVLRTFSNH